MDPILLDHVVLPLSYNSTILYADRVAVNDFCQDYKTVEKYMLNYLSLHQSNLLL